MDGNNIHEEHEREVEELQAEHSQMRNWSAQRIIETIAWIIEGILGFRFLLVIFGANTGNAFVSLINGLTNPLIAPFRNMFLLGSTSVNLLGAVLVAMIIYALVAWLIIAIIDSFRPHVHHDRHGHCYGPGCPVTR